MKRDNVKCYLIQSKNSLYCFRFMIEDWTFSTDTSNIIDFTSLSQSDITWSEMVEYSFPTVFAVEDDYCEIIIL